MQAGTFGEVWDIGAQVPSPNRLEATPRPPKYGRKEQPCFTFPDGLRGKNGSGHRVFFVSN